MTPPADMRRPLIGAGTYTFSLDAGAYPNGGHPDVLVYIPSRFDPTPPLSLIVYIHGFSNCVENIVRDAGGTCTPGGAVSASYALAAQLEASGKNAILVCPEVLFDQAGGNPGALGNVGGLKALLDETLGLLKPQLGNVSTSDVRRILVASHSGGYWATALMASQGGVPVDEVLLLDSLYGYEGTFEMWINSDLGSIASTRRRFASVYTCCSSGPETNTQNILAPVVHGYFPGDAGVVMDDRTSSTWTDDEYLHGVLLKFSMLTHDGVPRYYFGKLISTSGNLPAKP
jgi:hypothetical protein